MGRFAGFVVFLAVEGIDPMLVAELVLGLRSNKDFEVSQTTAGTAGPTLELPCLLILKV